MKLENFWNFPRKYENIPVDILNQQGMFLSEHTNNKLYGEVMVTPLSETVSINKITFNIGSYHFVGFRYKLIEMEQKIGSDFPILIKMFTKSNGNIESTEKTVLTIEEFSDAVAEIIKNPITQKIVNNIYWSTIEFEESLDEEDD